MRPTGKGSTGPERALRRLRPLIGPLALFAVASSTVRFTSIALKNPRKALAPNSSVCAATLDINADCALKAHRTTACIRCYEGPEAVIAIDYYETNYRIG